MALYFPVLREPRPPFDFNRENNLISTPMEAGYVKTRPRYTKNRRTFSPKFEYYTMDEYLMLDDFYTNHTSNGSLSFYFPLILNRGEYREDLFVQFVSPPKVQYVGMGLWSISLELREV